MDRSLLLFLCNVLDQEFVTYLLENGVLTISGLNVV